MRSSRRCTMDTQNQTVNPSTFGLVTAKTDPDGHAYSYGYDTSFGIAHFGATINR